MLKSEQFGHTLFTCRQYYFMFEKYIIHTIFYGRKKIFKLVHFSTRQYLNSCLTDNLN